MKMLGVIAQKGGTGKTTLSVHLAVQATRDGLRVLLLDMDPQASATAWWKRRRDEHPELIQGQGNALPGILEQARAHEYDLVIADTAPHSSTDAEALRLVRSALKTYPHMLTYRYIEQLSPERAVMIIKNGKSSVVLP